MSIKYTISSSDLGSLHFLTKEEYAEFKKDEINLWRKHHKILVDKYGYFAGNQNKYVASLNDFNKFDSIPFLETI